MPPMTTFSLSLSEASFMTSQGLASVQIWRRQSSRVMRVAHMPLVEVRSEVTRLWRTVWMVRLRRWLVDLELDSRRSLMILE